MSRKPVLISIDTEGPCGNDPVEHLIFGKTKDGRFAGIELLMDILDENDVKGLFFVDIAEAWECGKEKIDKVLKCIKGRGHDTAVHIHPDRMMDKERRYLWQYTKEEQREMIEKCTYFYEDSLGEKPVSFRAGRYGINNDTLELLDEYGYKFEMSQFYGNKYCKISPPLTCNKVVNYKNMKEIPVSSYKSFNFLGYERFDKVDVSMDYSEFKRVLKRMVKDDTVDMVSFFVHSFSMLKWRKEPDFPVFVKKNFDKINRMISDIRNMGFYFIEESCLDDVVSDVFDIKDITDYSDGLITWYYFFKRAAVVIKSRLENNI